MNVCEGLVIEWTKDRKHSAISMLTVVDHDSLAWDKLVEIKLTVNISSRGITSSSSQLTVLEISTSSLVGLLVVASGITDGDAVRPFLDVI